MKAALSIIDMQDHYLKECSEKEVKEKLNDIANLVRYSVEKDVPVIFIEMSNKGETIEDLTSLVPQNLRLTYNKHSQSPFEVSDYSLNQDFSIFLAKNGINKMFLTGAFGLACVFATARDILAYNKNVPIKNQIGVKSNPSFLLERKGIPQDLINNIYSFYRENDLFLSDISSVKNYLSD